MNWRKLNYLVPTPNCRTKDGVITEWMDNRPQPTDAEIEAVDINDVINEEEGQKEDNAQFDDFRLVVAKGLHNHENRIRALEGKPEVTLKQVIKALRSL